LKTLNRPEREVKEEAGLDIEIIQPLRPPFLHRGKKPENEFVGITFWCRSNSRKVRIQKSIRFQVG
jgi:8-oxo-dGTP pyrophosphatase MutT (NUDIX family)